MTNYAELLPFAKGVQVRVIELLANGTSFRDVAKQLDLNIRTVKRHAAAVRKSAALKFFSPEQGINNPLPEGFTASGISELRNERTGESVLRWYKSKTDQEKLIEMLVERLEEFDFKPAPTIPASKKQGSKDLLSLYTLTDFHLGMYAWSEETGDDWDTEIASKVLLNAIIDMASAAPDSETAILNLQGDFLHWDGLEAVTPMNKHILDADTRHDRMIELALDLTMWAIDILARKHKLVKVIICEGNHDIAGSAWLRKAMKKLYSKTKRIEVDDAAFPYYAHLHGETMLGFHHGHKTKNKSLPALFSSEPRYRSMWGEANYCYIHTGHYHQTEQDMSEFGGAIVERHPTLAGRDAYAARGGYVSRRAARVITYDKTLGEVGRSTVLPRITDDKPNKH